MLSKLLRLEWVFVHISALSPSAEEALTAEGIFPRSVELRYTLPLAEDPRGGGGGDAAAASTAPPQAHRPPHRAGGGSAPPQSQQPAASVNMRMRERFGSGRWGWAEGRANYYVKFCFWRRPFRFATFVIRV